MPRPKLIPTDEQRRIVKYMAAIGTPHEDIATLLDIRSPKTLRKHFRAELDRGAIEATAKVAGTLFQMATSGKCPAATFFFLKSHGWKEGPAREPIATSPAPFVVAKDPGGEKC
jgi:hypothetical protein